MNRRDTERLTVYGARAAQVFVIGGALAGWVALAIALWVVAHG